MAYWLNKDSRTFLSRGYLGEGQTAEDRIRVIAETAERILGVSGFADKFEDYMHKGWISLSSPVWSNFGTDRGLPISCNGSYFGDSVVSIVTKNAEVSMMTKLGAGTSGFFGDIRPKGAAISSGGTTNGPVHFMELTETAVQVISQSNVRRGSFAAYMPVEHPDIKEFLHIREEGASIQDLSLGVTITDDWIDSMKAGDKDKRKTWARIIQKRFETGYPYIMFTDTVNNNKPEVYKDKDMKIHASNLCAEIALPSSEEESFVCCLLSLNLLHFDEWEHTDLPKVAAYFLDAVMSEYIDKTEGVPFMQAARQFAMNHRAIGIGTLGWHSYLQSNMIAFESMEAKIKNVIIHKNISEKSLVASKELAVLLGEPEVLNGYGRRNTTLMAIAPTTSSSFILGQVSPSIEPLNSNYFTKDLQKGKFAYRNPHLEKLLEEKGQSTDEVWDNILINGGSVQQLSFLSEHEKDVFKTFGEIAQAEIIIQAAQRQKYIDQTQSLNLMIHPDTPIKDVSNLLLEAHRLQVKTLYYQRSTNPAQEFVRELLSCEACAL